MTANHPRRPPGAPAYYLGRPAHLWLAAHSPNRRRLRPAPPTPQTPAA
jgi:hypothetical protein